MGGRSAPVGAPRPRPPARGFETEMPGQRRTTPAPVVAMGATRITCTEVAAQNRRARFPAARRVGSLRRTPAGQYRPGAGALARRRARFQDLARAAVSLYPRSIVTRVSRTDAGRWRQTAAFRPNGLDRAGLNGG